MQRTSQQGGGRGGLDCRSCSAEAVLAQVAWLTTHAALARAREVAFPLHALCGTYVEVIPLVTYDCDCREEYDCSGSIDTLGNYPCMWSGTRRSGRQISASMGSTLLMPLRCSSPYGSHGWIPGKIMAKIAGVVSVCCKAALSYWSTPSIPLA